MIACPALRRCAAIAAALMLGACASTGGSAGKAGIVPFRTDGCSYFPDRGCKADWCSCCVMHDLAYWRGGTAEKRREADGAFRQCVSRASNGVLAGIMYTGVRLFAGPYLPTSFRWGFGWPVGRPYGPLTADEESAASALEREYIATNPTLSCPGPAIPAAPAGGGIHPPGS